MPPCQCLKSPIWRKKEMKEAMERNILRMARAKYSHTILDLAFKNWYFSKESSKYFSRQEVEQDKKTIEETILSTQKPFQSQDLEEMDLMHPCYKAPTLPKTEENLFLEEAEAELEKTILRFYKCYKKEPMQPKENRNEKIPSKNSSSSFAVISKKNQELEEILPEPSFETKASSNNFSKTEFEPISYCSTSQEPIKDLEKIEDKTILRQEIGLSNEKLQQPNTKKPQSEVIEREQIIIPGQAPSVQSKQNYNDQTRI